MYGLDVVAASLKPPTAPDIMSYCLDPWISDYTYKKVQAFREASALRTQTSLTQRQPTLLIWGHIVNGQPVLEPAFQIVTRPSLPTAPGPYSVEATASDGSRLFALSLMPSRWRMILRKAGTSPLPCRWIRPARPSWPTSA